MIQRAPDHVIVLGEDWMGLYIYGRLVAEGHSLSTSDVLSALGIMWRVLPADQTWLEESGSLPERLDDVETGT